MLIPSKFSLKGYRVFLIIIMLLPTLSWKSVLISPRFQSQKQLDTLTRCIDFRTNISKSFERQQLVTVLPTPLFLESKIRWFTLFHECSRKNPMFDF